ncbi:hypothetical protein [Sulfobacillus harzensis]|uniref:Uncharacterized protein n=1 Tax=Sulfobacillus harzensis TaxID=2729629 RepID=A0A7Y0L4P5_9FIRM|nr:hypothetical protein [Sulfobacillus harzensis]NMP22631.1 hypothetical protein [Sulfobacillus harzensis]
MSFVTFWTTGSEQEWNRALERYWPHVRPANVQIEREMAELDRRSVQSLQAQEFYDWLYHKYFVWKYTQPNRLATTRESLASHHAHAAGLVELQDIQRLLFATDPRDTLDEAPANAGRIGGLGMAGASGLLANPLRVKLT